MENVIDAFKKALANDEACKRYVQGYRAEQKEKSAMDLALERLQEAAARRGIAIRS